MHENTYHTKPSNQPLKNAEQISGGATPTKAAAAIFIIVQTKTLRRVMIKSTETQVSVTITNTVIKRSEIR